MSKTKEIEVILYEADMDGYFKKYRNNIPVFARDHEAANVLKTLKAKLVIEIPEKSVTLTESAFEAVVKSAGFVWYGENSDIGKIKHKLFGDAE